jgi:hypothetical protein
MIICFKKIVNLIMVIATMVKFIMAKPIINGPTINGEINYAKLIIMVKFTTANQLLLN